MPAEKSKRLSKSLFWLFLGLIAVVGMVLVFLATRWGAFLGDDSYYYIAPARAALAGEGFMPSPYFGPGLPFVMLVLGWLGVPLVPAIRFLNVALFGLNLVLLGLILRKMGLRLSLTLWVVSLVAVVDVFVEAHSHAMSEPLYLTFTLAAFLTLLQYLKRGGWGWLLGCALASAAASLTRYAALPIVPTVAVVLLIYDRRHRFGRRLLNAVGFGLVAVLPLGAYFLRNRLVSGRLTRYESFSIPPLGRDKLRWLLYSIESWFIPGRFVKGREFLAALILALILLAVAIGFWLLHRKAIKAQARPFFTPGLAMWAVFILFNLAMLYLVRGLEGLAPYNARYLLPVLMSLLVIAAVLVDWFWDAARVYIKIALAVFCVVFLGYYAFRGQDFVRQMYRTGMGYSNVGWQQSETIPFIQSHPDVAFVATGEMGIYFWTGEKPAPIVAYGSIPGLHAHMCESGALLVLMKQMPTEIYGYAYDEVVTGLELAYAFNDSEIYRCPE